MTKRTHIDDLEPNTYDKVSHYCDECSLTIKGTAADPQESAWLFCPECGYEMEYNFGWAD